MNHNNYSLVLYSKASTRLALSHKLSLVFTQIPKIVLLLSFAAEEAPWPVKWLISDGVQILDQLHMPKALVL